MRDRDEHLEFCKKRAHEFAERGELLDAVTSMLSDLEKHDDTKLGPDSPLSALAIMWAAEGDHANVVRWIDGFH